jgi:hypothetical protein
MTINGPLITNIGLFFSIFFVIVGSLDFGRGSEDSTPVRGAPYEPSVLLSRQYLESQD